LHPNLLFAQYFLSMASAATRRVRSRPGGSLVAVIGDEDTATGFLLAGVGENNATLGPNYFVVDSSTLASLSRPLLLHFAASCATGNFIPYSSDPQLRFVQTCLLLC
jgi:ATP synthase (F/14-kDa) subunit